MTQAMLAVISRVSVDSAGAEGNSGSENPSISNDGRYVAFESSASNLVAGDTNGIFDIFVHDMQTGATTRVSVDSAGAEENSFSSEALISGDGRYVVFELLVGHHFLGTRDIFVHDRQTGATTRVSVDSAGAQGNGFSRRPSISDDGRYVVFESEATNLVAGDTNGISDVFVHDRQTGATTRVSVDSAGAEGNEVSSRPSISGDGRYVAFQSFASNLVAGDTNGTVDVFVHDRQTGATTRVSVDSAGAEGNSFSSEASISGDGRYVAFQSFASNLVAGDMNGIEDVFVHDMQTGATTRVSVDSVGAEGNDFSSRPSISGVGRYVAFASFASNLVAGDTNGLEDVFVRDRQTGTTTRVSVDAAGAQGNSDSFGPSIGGDGRYVAFASFASNLVAGDTNGFGDIFQAPNP